MTVSRVLVTGAAGFLGSAIVRQAVNAGLSVIATDRIVRPKSTGLDFYLADILDPISLFKIFDGVECVCHVAGLVHSLSKSKALEKSFYDVNVVGTENVVHAAAGAGVRHVVFISSISVYGGVAHGQDEEAKCHPESPYAESKLQAEQSLIDRCLKEGMNLTILRLATLYGEGDSGNVARLIQSIDRGRFLWVGKGKNLKSLLYCEDAAGACIEVIKTPVSGINIYNVAAPACKMSEIVATISGALDKSVPSWHVPSSVALNLTRMMKILSFNLSGFSALHDMLQKWLADDHYNADKFCRTFNFKTKVHWDEGIQKEVAWYKANAWRSGVF